MGNNEAYLDSLLNAMNGEENAGGNDGNKMMSADEIAAMFAAMEQSAPAEEPITEAEEPAPIEELAEAEESVPVEEEQLETEEPISLEEQAFLPEDDISMELPRDLLEDLMEKFGAQEAEEMDETSVPESDAVTEMPEVEYTTESTQNLSAEEIEKLLAATEQMAEENIAEESVSFSEEEAIVDEMSHEDLLALLGGLDGVGGTAEEETVAIGQDAYAGMEKELDAQDVMSGAAISERSKERKERKKKEKLEKQAAKKALKEATKEAKKAAKEAKKQQVQRQKTAEEEMALEEVSLEEMTLEEAVFGEKVTEEAVEAESVLDLFTNSESGQEESVSIFDFAGISDDNVEGNDTQAEVMMSWDDDTEEEDKDTSAKTPKGKKKNKENREKKKDGLLSKFLSFLTEEDEEPVQADDNQSILEELEAEDKEETKKQKGKKGKAAKGKKGKGEAEGEDGEKDDKKKEKKKKQPKPKKVKEVKLKPVEDERPSKRVSPKSVAVIIAFAATVFLVVFFAGSYFSTMLHRNEAKAAFERMDYASCYAGLYGMELSEEEREMLKHAELVLRMQRHIELYETYHADEKELEALDSLMQAVAEYEDAYAKALDCGAGPEVAALYENVLDILKASYGVSQEEAHKIAACESNVEYTRYLTALIGGESDTGMQVEDDEMQDVLPQEEELANPDFAD